MGKDERRKKKEKRKKKKEKRKKKKEKRKKKKGSGTPKDADPYPPCPHLYPPPLAGGGQRRGHGSRLAARSPLGVPPRLLPEGRQSPRLSFRPGFLGRGFNGRYPLSPVPVQWQHPTHRS